MKNDNQPLWVPSQEFKEHSNLRRYMLWLKSNRGLDFENYELLWEWSVKNIADFWESIWEFCAVQSYTPYTKVLNKPAGTMVGTNWFEGATVNYAEHIFRNKNTSNPAIISQSEQFPLKELSWQELEWKVASIAAYLKGIGIERGDRVVAVMPNIPETVMIFLAVNSIGAVWSSCSPDFGNAGIIDRFQQIEPKVLFFADGYSYNGKLFDKTESLKELKAALPTLTRVVLVPFIDSKNALPDTVRLDEILQISAGGLEFEAVPFSHPIWIVYSSGTTGKPKAITHSVGGCLLEHLKTLILHQDVKPGDRYFWYSTTGWMMWNFSVASMLAGASLVLYEGAAAYPDLHVLWNLAIRAGVHHFGGGAAFYIACMKIGLELPSDSLKQLRTIGSTGSPLPAEGFEWIYNSIKKDVWLISFSGGTDICSGFVGGCPLWPVYAGEIQCRLLGSYVEAFDENGKLVHKAVGEMVILEPMPSMPIYFWNDTNNEKYTASYFEQYPGIWRHGDWIEITDRNSVIIFGRSDATLNRDGVRIGTSEIYAAVDQIPEISDSIVVCAEVDGGKYFMPLFVVLKQGAQLNEELKRKIKTALKTQYSPRHVPDEIIAVSEIPYTISGKKMEMPVKKILMGMDISKLASRDTMRNPESLDFFIQFAKAHQS